MYNLGDQFKINYKNAVSDNSIIVKGEKFRITIMTERLIRLEYNENGVFEDRPTEFAIFRNFKQPKYGIKQDNNVLEITTKYFKLTYNKNKHFKGNKINPSSNLKVELLNTDKIWYYNHPEARNFGTPGTFFSDKKGKVKLEKGLYSTDGFVSFDDSKTPIIDENGFIIDRKEKCIDIYLFMYLKDFALCLTDYYNLTGFPPLIPRYALGNWWSKNSTYNDITLSTLIKDFNRKGVPLSVLLLNDSWHINEYNNTSNIKSGFTWNKNLFKNPYELISALHDINIKIGLTLSPEKFYPFEEQYETAKKYLEVSGDSTIPFNILDEKSLDVYFKLFIHPLEALGVDFFCLDKKDFKLSHYHIKDIARNMSKREMLFGYNNLIAPHRYSVLYSGNIVVGWDTLKKVPLHNSSAANIGVSFWSHDIGGFYKGIEDSELYTRFVQLGVFSPILKFGSEDGKYYKREPWAWDVSTFTIASRYLNLRHKLIPYLYTECYKYHRYGIPLIQPIYYKYPEMYDDPEYKNEYFFGSELFVSPILKKKDTVMNRVVHNFFIPDGVWYNFITGQKFIGNKSYVTFFKDEEYPVFAKAGAIIVTGYNDIINDTNPPKNLEIQIFPGMSNNYKLYEDDGITNLYKNNNYLLTDIDYNYMPNNYTVIIRSLEGKMGIVPEKRNYKIVFRNIKKTNDVIAYFNNDQIKCNTYNDGLDFIVEVKDINSVGQLTINCKGKGIEIDAVRLIEEDINSIISDLSIETDLKEKIDKIMFSDLPIKKKRIEIRNLHGDGLDPKFINLFIKLLEYINEV